MQIRWLLQAVRPRLIMPRGWLINIAGQNFSIATIGNGETGNAPSATCSPCVSGMNVFAGGFFTGDSLGSGNATINGMTFNNIGFLGTFNIGSAAITLPVGTSDLVF